MGLTVPPEPTRPSKGRRRPAERLHDVHISGIREVLEALTRWEGPGRVPVPFHLGMPDFDTPQHIKDALHAAVEAGFVRYTSSLGLPEARAAIARKLQRENGISADPEDAIVVTCGANEAISATILALIDPGDEVIVPDPTWPHYEYCLRMAGAVPVRCQLHEDRGFTLEPDAVARLWSARTRMVIINSPHNPTGAVMAPADVLAIAHLARDRGAWLLSDEAYERIVYDGEHLSPASLPDLGDTVLTVGCLSKAYAMTGWRLGYLCGPPAVVEAVNRVHLYSVTCAVSRPKTASYGGSAWFAGSKPTPTASCMRESKFSPKNPCRYGCAPSARAPKKRPIGKAVPALSITIIFRPSCCRMSRIPI